MKKSSLSDQIIGVVLIILVFPLILMLIWNAVIPGMFGLPTLGYWSAMGLYLGGAILEGAGLVCNILFK